MNEQYFGQKFERQVLIQTFFHAAQTEGRPQKAKKQHLRRNIQVSQLFGAAGTAEEVRRGEGDRARDIELIEISAKGAKAGVASSETEVGGEA